MKPHYFALVEQKISRLKQLSKTKTYIELNGATYSAGRQGFVSSVGVIKPTLDGFVRRAPVKAAAQAPKNAAVTTKTSGPHKVQPAHRKAQRSHTLMRQVVNKPVKKQLLHAKATPINPAGSNGSNTEHVTLGLRPERLERAANVSKSGFVKKFNAGGVYVRNAVLSVVEPPNASLPAAHHSHEPSVTERALENARSHEQPKPKKARWHHSVARRLHVKPGVLSIGAAVIAVLVLGGFVFYQNIANISVRMAATRAGLHASLPNYHPTGFSLKGPIHYANGELTVNFQSNSDNRAFQVKQQASSWNSETLLQAYVAKQQQPYQTYEDSGRTVYINNDGANLVSNNKWIQVKSDGSLSTQQLLNIVKSIN